MLRHLLLLVAVALHCLLFYGCTKIVRLTPEQASEKPPGNITAISLQDNLSSTYPLPEIDSVIVSDFSDSTGTQIQKDTLSAAEFRTRTIAGDRLRIINLILLSGRDPAIRLQQCYYDRWNNRIEVVGDKIVFDSLHGKLDTVQGLVTGQSIAGDSVEARLSEIAFVEYKATDRVKTVLLTVGILSALAFAAGVIYFSAMPSD